MVGQKRQAVIFGQERVTNMSVKKNGGKKNVVSKKNTPKFDKVSALDRDVKKGRWVTVNGRHKFIEEKK